MRTLGTSHKRQERTRYQAPIADSAQFVDGVVAIAAAMRRLSISSSSQVPGASSSRRTPSIEGELAVAMRLGLVELKFKCEEGQLAERDSLMLRPPPASLIKLFSLFTARLSRIDLAVSTRGLAAAATSVRAAAYEPSEWSKSILGLSRSPMDAKGSAPQAKAEWVLPFTGSAATVAINGAVDVSSSAVPTPDPLR
eukprot:scaffold230636_cov32-Tisochrysis_lutea.AAC.2